MRPIGIIDSGFGGLTVARQINNYLPREDLIFACDCGYAPWGEKSDIFINTRIDVLVNFLLRKNVKAIVLACNTATAVAAQRLRNTHSIPIIGIEPALLPAVKGTKTHAVGVLATPKTVESDKYHSLYSRAIEWAKRNGKEDIKIISTPAPGLMQCVENGEFSSANTINLIRQFTAEMVKENCDSLVLGCTHYPFLIEAMTKLLPKMKFYDPAPSVAKHLKETLEENHLLTTSNISGKIDFYTTKPTEYRNSILNLLWGKKNCFSELI